MSIEVEIKNNIRIKKLIKRSKIKKNKENFENNAKITKYINDAKRLTSNI